MSGEQTICAEGAYWKNKFEEERQRSAVLVEALEDIIAHSGNPFRGPMWDAEKKAIAEEALKKWERMRT